MPIYYNAGFKATLLAPLLIGCSVAFCRIGLPARFRQGLAELRPTWLTASPAWLQALVECVSQPGSAARFLRFVLSTASYLPVTTGIERNDCWRRPSWNSTPVRAGMMTGPSLAPDQADPVQSDASRRRADHADRGWPLPASG